MESPHPLLTDALRSMGLQSSQLFAEGVPSDPRFLPARVSRQERDRYLVLSPELELEAVLPGRLRQEAHDHETFPAVGDWVLVRPVDARHSVVEALLPRRSLLVRRAPGAATRAQPIAANVDVAAVVCSAIAELNLRRIERFLAGLWSSGATPALIVNKIDRVADRESLTEQLAQIAMSVPVHFTSAERGDGVEALRTLVPAGRTGVLLGASGVGKSTLLNRLCGGERQSTGAVREEDDKGRHTTTRRELFPLSHGAWWIDTPGIREFQLWDGDLGGFGDVEEHAAECRFRDCQHEREPGCAVRAAVERGVLDPGRLEHFHRLRREQRHVDAEKDVHLRLAEKRRDKSLAKLVRKVVRDKRSQ